MYYPTGQKFARNCSISYGFLDIHTFSFSAKIQDGRQKWRKLKFFPLQIEYSCTTLQVKNRSKYLVQLSRYSHLFIFRKNPRWPPKVVKIEIFPLCIGYSCTIQLVKNSLEIALSLMVLEIFTPFHFPLKSKMVAKSGEN